MLPFPYLQYLRNNGSIKSRPPLQQRYWTCQNRPILSICFNVAINIFEAFLFKNFQVKPLLLVGADHPHLLCSTERVVLGPPGSPAALHTGLGWTLQGPISFLQEASSTFQCHFLAASSKDQLQMDVEKLWQVDVIPYALISKTTDRSKRDQEALECLEQRTEQVKINGIARYATSS